MYYIQNPLSNRDAALDEIARRYGYEYQRRKYVETYPYINSVYGSNDIRIRELVERYGVNGTPYIPNPKTVSIGNITSNGIILPQDLNSGIARLSAVRGRSLVWNQLIHLSDTEITKNGVTYTPLGNGKFRISGTATSNVTTLHINNVVLLGTIGHKYFIFAPAALSANFYIQFEGLGIYASSGTNIYTCSTAGTLGNVTVRVSSGVSVDWEGYIQCVDLTIMFGEGNEPSTIEEFKAMYKLLYYNYNPGTIINNNASAIESVGLNQWDEEWEVGGFVATTGQPVDSFTNRIRSKNYNSVIKATTYYVLGGLLIYEYDEEKNFIGFRAVANNIYEFDANCSFFKISTDPAVAVITTYNNDICINISNPALNGTYKPYKKDTLTLNLSTIKGKLNGEGESVTIFPDGMRGAGTAYDYIIVDADGYARKAVKVMESVDLGTLSYWLQSRNYWRAYFTGYKEGSNMDLLQNIVCSKYVTITPHQIHLNEKVGISMGSQGVVLNSVIIFDPSYETVEDFKAAMSGVELIYELATPQEYVLDEPIYTFFEVEKGGILRAKYNDSEQVHAPLDVDLIYSEAK